MSITIPDPALVAVLTTATGVDVELRSPDGQLIGWLTPAPRPGMKFPQFGMTDEEIERYDTDPNATWVTAEQVEARLRELRGTP